MSTLPITSIFWESNKRLTQAGHDLRQPDMSMRALGDRHLHYAGAVHKAGVEVLNYFAEVTSAFHHITLRLEVLHDSIRALDRVDAYTAPQRRERVCQEYSDYISWLKPQVDRLQIGAERCQRSFKNLNETGPRLTSDREAKLRGLNSHAWWLKSNQTANDVRIRVLAQIHRNVSPIVDHLVHVTAPLFQMQAHLHHFPLNSANGRSDVNPKYLLTQVRIIATAIHRVRASQELISSASYDIFEQNLDDIAVVEPSCPQSKTISPVVNNSRLVGDRGE